MSYIQGCCQIKRLAEMQRREKEDLPALKMLHRIKRLHGGMGREL
jgi:hypothetical protein